MSLKNGAERFKNRKGGTQIETGPDSHEGKGPLTREQEAQIHERGKTEGMVKAGRTLYEQRNATGIAATQRKLAANELARALRSGGLK